MLFCVEVKLPFRSIFLQDIHFWRAGLHLLLDVSFCLFSRAETCLELFPQRLFRKSDKTNAASPIGTMGGDGSSLLGCGPVFQKSHENMCFCCCLSHWDTFSFMQPANHSHYPGIISQKTLSRALIYFCRLTAFPHNSYLCLRTQAQSSALSNKKAAAHQIRTTRGNSHMFWSAPEDFGEAFSQKSMLVVCLSPWKKLFLSMHQVIWCISHAIDQGNFPGSRSTVICLKNQQYSMYSCPPQYKSWPGKQLYMYISHFVDSR